MLLDSGHHVTLLDNHNPITDNCAAYRFLRYPSINIRVNSEYATINRLFGRINRLIDLIRFVYLKVIFHKVKPDIVHLHRIDIRAYDCFRANLHPLILTAWGSDINYLCVPGFFKETYIKRIVKALSSADHITTDASDILQKCISLLGHELSISLYYFGIDFNLFKPGYFEEARNLKQSIGISQDDKVILSVRAFKPKMGHHFILDAFARIVAEPRYRNTRLVFKRYNILPKNYENQIRSQVEHLGLTNYVIWIDSISYEKMPILYAMSDIVVNYPEMDGFPISFLETAACKRPMVSNILPAYAGMVPEGSFWMVPPNSIPDLAKAFKEALNADPPEIVQRTEKAYAHAKKIGEWNRWVQSTEDLYKLVIQQWLHSNF